MNPSPTSIFVMPGQPGPAFGRPGCELDPGIHLFAQQVDCRVEPGNDV
jgi:hypothetical protein